MRKVQDHYFHKAKKENYPARSVYKLEEAQKRFGILRAGNTVLDLGCAPGSWTLYAAKVVGRQGLVVGVDLQKTTLDLSRIDAAVTFLTGDMTDATVQERIRTCAPFYDVVLCDAAPRTSGNRFADHQQSLALCRAALGVACCLLRLGGAMYCKIFQGEDFDDFLQEMKQAFARVKPVKPKSSRQESREVFILGQGFRGRLHE